MLPAHFSDTDRRAPATRPESSICRGPLEIKCRTQRLGEDTVLFLTGQFDLHTSPEVKGHVARAASVELNTLIIDLDGLTFLDCSAVSALISIHATVRPNPMVVICRRPPLARVLAITEMHRKIPVCSSLEEARQTVAEMRAEGPWY